MKLEELSDGYKNDLGSLASICTNPDFAMHLMYHAKPSNIGRLFGISQMKHLILQGNLRSFAELCSHYNVSSSYKLAHRQISH